MREMVKDGLLERIGRAQYIVARQPPPSTNTLGQAPTKAVRLIEYEVTAGAANGGGVEIHHNPIGEYWVDTVEIEGREAHVIEVMGDSMKPDFFPGEKVIVVPASEDDRFRVPYDGVYVFRIEDAIYLKRLARQPGSVVLALSRNENYPPFSIDLASDDFELAGRVYGKFERY